jgi:IMP dehydrogenase
MSESTDEKIVSQGLTFDDVLLLPGYSDFKRADVDLTTTLHPSIVLPLPLVSSPMDTVTEEAMARSVALAGGLGIIHRNLTVSSQADMVRSIKQSNVGDGIPAAFDSERRLLVGAAVGTGSDLEERVKALVDAGVDVIAIDSGHGNTKFVVEAVSFIKNTYPHVVVMAGNIATSDGAKRLAEAGADILRVGMGPGSICTTRIISGMGVPQLTAVMEAVKGAKGTNATIVADGGVRQIGDMAKALAVGAHAVMLGSLLAGYDESPGEKVLVDGKEYKQYRGMGSIAAMQKGSAERYGQTKDTKEKQLIAEGVEGLVHYKGDVADYLAQISGSLRSSLYYIGAKSVSEFAAIAKLTKITQASLTESHPHSIAIVNAGSNYTL